MFSRYNLKLNKDFFDKNFYYYEKIGKEHLSGIVCDYQNDLEEYIKKGSINGTALQNEWFPEMDVNIFISHSHIDISLANALAGWIYYNFGLKVFIDSNVWNYSDDLLEKLNSKYSNKRIDHDGGYLYEHKSCNEVSKHVNIMLSIALQKMIDKTECVILLNTDNSIKVFDEKNNKIASTYSPWIYSEIVSTQIVRKKPLLLYRNYPLKFIKSMTEGASINQENLKISYNVSLKHLTNLDSQKLLLWLNNYNRNDSYKEYPLDALYYITHKNELMDTISIYENCTRIEMDLIKNCLTGCVDEEDFKFNINLYFKDKYCNNNDYIM